MNGYRIGVDIGGTFTDFVVEGEGRRITLKLLTTHDAPERAVLQGLERLQREAGVAPERIAAVVHGTTLATNAVIERRGALVGFLTTEGFRDTLEMAYEHRYDQYDLLVEKPEPLVTRRLRLPIGERMTAAGAVVRPLDETAVVAAAATLRAAGVQAVAIGFLHAYVNDAHERRAATILARELPGIPVSLSSEVSPEIREYDRFSTVVANAYVQPLMAAYLGRLEDALRRLGVPGPLLLIQSNGGLCDVASACRFPVRLLESGPAGGAIFAAAVAAATGVNHALLLDIGGTTAKLCLIDDGAPQMARTMEVARIDRFKQGSGLPLRFPVVELCEIGAGGGSIAGVDRLGRLQVGPRSAGSSPGPACYGLGGNDPTVTDAHLALGRLTPTDFAAGAMQLDPGAAAFAIEERIAVPLALSRIDAARGVVEIVNEHMANAAREHAIETGKTLTGRTLIAIGGAAGLHVAELAEKLGIEDVVVPADAGVGSAIGFLRAPLAFERTRTHHQALASLDTAATAALVGDLLATVGAELAATGLAAGPTRLQLTAQMRYRGQGYEVTTVIDPARLAAADLQDAFEEAYAKLYRRTMPGAPIEVLAWTARAAADPGAAAAPPAAAAAGRIGYDVMVDQKSGAPLRAMRARRGALEPRIAHPGPVCIADDGATIVVPAGWRVTLNGDGALALRRTDAERTEAAA